MFGALFSPVLRALTYTVWGDSVPVRRYKAPGTRYDRLKVDPVRYKHKLGHGTLENHNMRMRENWHTRILSQILAGTLAKSP